MAELAKVGMSAEQSALWRSLIHSRLGMVLPVLQHQLFERRVLDRMSACRLDMSNYYQRVRQDVVEWQRLAEALVVHETAFFRHPASYELVAQHLSHLNRDVSLWSVGCSTGEEAWSLAMTARRHALKNFKIMATDISEQALSTARRGVYASRRFEQIPDSLRERFCVPLSEHEAQIHATLMSQVSFYRFNLMDVASAPFRRLDVIFCQNVLIYFKKFDRRDILDALVQRLELGGLLVLGPGEMLDWRHPQMRRVDHSGTLAFERVKL